MNEEILPPSPNWYLSKILACSSEGTLAYGSRCNIIIAKSGPDQGLQPDIQVIVNAHQDRVTVLVYSTAIDNDSKFKNCIASCGDDAIIRIWDLNTLAPIQAHTSHNAKVVCMDWSRANVGLVVSTDTDGSIIAWDLNSNTTQSFFLGKMSPTCIACCPHKRDLIAVGCRNGHVLVASLKGPGKILHRLRGHDSEILSLAWCPVPYNTLRTQICFSNEDLLLASAAKDRNIYIWRAGSDGRSEQLLHCPVTPLNSNNHKSKVTTNGQNVGWMCLAWPEPHIIFTSGIFGELLRWDLKLLPSNRSESNKETKNKKSWSLLHTCHARGLFSIACSPGQPLSYTDECSQLHARITGKPITSRLVWTTAQDRLLTAFDLNTGKVVVNVPTMGGFVYCCAISPLDANRVALGVGDSMIRVWNFASPRSLDISSFWQKVQSKVMALAWHPIKDGILAFATGEGRVGFFDVNNLSKPPILLKQHHRRCVYSLSWGPPLGRAEVEDPDKPRLFSCGDGDLFQYDMDFPDRDPVNIKELIHESNPSIKKSLVRTDLAWKPDLTSLALGNEDGTVHVFSVPNLTLTTTLYSHKKLIQSMCWHPESTATDTGYSPYRNWLAVASNENVVKVFDLADPSATKMLSGHLSRLVKLAWSPHIGGQLVTVSYDETAQVWDVANQRPIANFSGHCNSVYCCAWSPLDPDLILTGSADFTLRVWRISLQDKILPVEKKKARKIEQKRLIQAAEATAIETMNLNTNGKAQRVKIDIFNKYNEENDVEYARTEKEVRESLTSLTLSPLVVGSSKKKASSSTLSRRSFFPASSHSRTTHKGQYSVLDILDNSNELGEGRLLHYGFFGDDKAMSRMLCAEENHHQVNTNIEMSHHIALWRGDLTETIREATRKKQLNDWLVSMAPMVSQKVWTEAAQAYAIQLTLVGAHQKAASYLLACHKIDEAIDLLAEHKMFREAVAIAHSRLPADDSTFHRLLSQWGKHLTGEGNYEMAVDCLVANNDLYEAAKLLSRREDASQLLIAAELARRDPNSSDLALNISSKAVFRALITNQWDIARQAIEKQSELSGLQLLVSMHSALISDAPMTREIFWKWLHGEISKDVKPLLEMLEGDLLNDLTVYDVVERHTIPTISLDSWPGLWLAVSKECTLAACTPDPVKKLEHLVLAANFCGRYEIQQPSACPLAWLCYRLAPSGPLATSSPFSLVAVHKEMINHLRSLRAFLTAGIIHCLAGGQFYEFQAKKSENGEEECIISELITSFENEKEETIIPWQEVVGILLECKNDLIDRRALNYYTRIAEIQTCEREVAKTAALGSHSSSTIPGISANSVDVGGDGGGGDNTPTLPKTSLISSGAANSERLKLAALKTEKNAFEKERVAAPNPFLFYCRLRSICQEHIQPHHPELGEKLEKEYADVWLSITKQQPGKKDEDESKGNCADDIIMSPSSPASTSPTKSLSSSTEILLPETLSLSSKPLPSLPSIN